MSKDRMQDCLSQIMPFKVYVITMKQLFSTYCTISYTDGELHKLLSTSSTQKIMTQVFKNAMNFKGYIFFLPSGFEPSEITFQSFSAKVKE